MRSRQLTILMVLAAVCVGCAVSKGQPDGMYINNPALPKLSTLPDPSWEGYSPDPSGYGAIFRPIALLLSPVAVALDYVLMRPLYMLGSTSPEWFGFSVDDAQAYHDHLPREPIDVNSAPRYRWE
jgi:hypothetical protein